MPKYTPGPWWVDDDGFVASGHGDTYETIADPNCGDRDQKENAANTRLIAAAPELADAALRALCDYECMNAPYRNVAVVEALRKALTEAGVAL